MRMVESKYEKYIITKVKPNRIVPEYRHESPINIPGDVMTQLASVDDEVIKGAFNIGTVWLWPRPGISNKVGVDAHTHPFNEILGLFGTNPDDPEDLCGEIELWLADEIHVLTKSCLIFIPAGMRHCPWITRRVDRPIFHFGVHK
jgi:hypothetical protein